MKFISFIGSNSRDLYVHNIYQSLSLPKKQIIQYRYDKKYISDDILGSLKKQKGKRGVIFYLYDPGLELGYKGTITSMSSTVLSSIREVIVKEIRPIDDLDQVHFYIELGDFVRVDNGTKDYLLKKVTENKTFVHYFTNPLIYSQPWKNKIEEIKDYFENIHFFYINRVFLKKNHRDHEIKYDPDKFQNSLFLQDDSSYNIEFFTYDKTEGKSPITIQTDNNYLVINEPLETGTKINSKILKIITRQLDFKQDFTYIKIEDEKSRFPVLLSVYMKKKWFRSILFALASSTLFISFPLVDFLQDKNNIEELSQIYILLIVTFFVFGATLILHRFYNK